MHNLVHHLYDFFANLGGFGLLLLGILDSSFLFMPLGNDLLLVGLTVENRAHWAYFVPMAAIGSTLGCLLLDFATRKGGEAGLQKMLSKRRFEYVKRKVGQNAAAALAVACVAPPPFPFTPVVAAAAAFDYPRPKLLGTVFVGRLVRFSIVAGLALYFGQRIIQLANQPMVQTFIIGFVALCVIGSGISIWRWVQKSRTRA